VVLADDDVRYDAAALDRVVSLLSTYDLVRPSNYYSRLPWYARWDTSRTLLNRALGADYPGTLGVRRPTVERAGGYRGDVLFENLELIRTVKAVGGAEHIATDVYVARVPPTYDHFRGQRVRQAYDDFAQPGRLMLELSLLPLVCWAMLRPRRVLGLALAISAVAEVGRRRARGVSVYPADSSLWAPMWVAERAVCVWLAVGYRRRGVPYAGGRLKTAGTSQRELNRRLRDRRQL
jgi:hypothetical protein